MNQAHVGPFVVSILEIIISEGEKGLLALAEGEKIDNIWNSF